MSAMSGGGLGLCGSNCAATVRAALSVRGSEGSAPGRRRRMSLRNKLSASARDTTAHLCLHVGQLFDGAGGEHEYADVYPSILLTA